MAVPGHLAGPDSESVAPPGTGASTRGATGLHPSRRFWTVTALGDSVVSGTNCACAPFVQRYAELAAQSTGVTVKVTNLGVPGLTSTGLTARLAGEPETRGSVAGSDIVLVTIGANDLAPALTEWQRDACNLSCFTQVLPTIGDNIGAAVQQIYRLRSGRATEILFTDYWNVFLDGQVAGGAGKRLPADQRRSDPAGEPDDLPGGDGRRRRRAWISMRRSRAAAGRATRRRCSPTTATTPTQPGTG